VDKAQQAETVGKAKPPPPVRRYGRVVEKPDHMPPTWTEGGINKNLARPCPRWPAG
jgi:hypothetical protein